MIGVPIPETAATRFGKGCWPAEVPERLGCQYRICDSNANILAASRIACGYFTILHSGS